MCYDIIIKLTTQPLKLWYFPTPKRKLGYNIIKKVLLYYRQVINKSGSLKLTVHL